MPASVVTAAEMREMDRITIEELGVPGATLMERAGRHVADEAEAMLAPGANVVVVCGPGNNGGDGYVCGRILLERGHDVQVMLASGRPRQGDAAHHLALFEAAGGRVLDLSGHEAGLGSAGLIVDALLGTGLQDRLREDLVSLIQRINDAPALKLAVDIPSGLSADTGQPLGAAVRAHRTVTFGFAKVGLVTAPGFDWAGEVRVVDIGIPAHLAARLSVKLRLLDEEGARALMPRRERTSHKGTHGHVLAIAGSPGKVGAALLCAASALRSGAGLVTVAASPDARSSLEGRVWEVMTAELDASRPGALDELVALAERKRAIVWGPGMPTTQEAGDLLRASLDALAVPIVLDADALNHLAGDPSLLRSTRCQVVLTPHPGEAARLLGETVARVQADRVAAARQLADKTGAVVVLKGARSVVAMASGEAVLNPTGNPGMATAGIGDVLAGVVAALLGQGLGPFSAACLGAFVHGRAGDMAAAVQGEMGLVAGDVMGSLPQAFRSLGG